MDTFSAVARGMANRGKEPMVFDWLTAAKLLREEKAVHAAAGLRDDWEYTGGPILSHGLPMPADETYVYLASTWAVPELQYETPEGETKLVECFKLASELPGWNSDTYWPQIALEAFGIIEGEKGEYQQQLTGEILKIQQTDGKETA